MPTAPRPPPAPLDYQSPPTGHWLPDYTFMFFWTAERLVRWFTVVALLASNAYGTTIITGPPWVTFALLLGGLGVLVWVCVAAAVLIARPYAAARAPLGRRAVAVGLGAALVVCAVSTDWPLRVGFFVSRPALERMAASVAAGTPVTAPTFAGIYRIERGEVMPDGTVGLFCAGNTADWAGFLLPPQVLAPGQRPRGNNRVLRLDKRWWWSDED